MPGLHSLYSGLDLTFTAEAAGAPQLNFKVVRADRYGSVRMEVDGPGFHGEARAMVRPAPSKQVAAGDLAGVVAKDAFSGQRAVVIGGSRGLGEVTAKLLAMGGADVTITYHRGKGDAEAIAAEIAAAGEREGGVPAIHRASHSRTSITSRRRISFRLVLMGAVAGPARKERREEISRCEAGVRAPE